ncbi:hypothetical protein KFL_001990100 [Klebsormidium nitens]|uniref:VLRF1 domain-containing protein n=1 Tax=Klebsormidium nitens TaxID=105231 RepID=A0A1Y1I7G5_KLENI|nr:hypothetical protein KFL_001990100 [Klebsormidium nitens]|eukprot:GAQ84657.1 hypothetical protein KFL_001990100 [Klebsormidium nitens]
MAPKAAVPKALEQSVPSDIFQLTHSFLSGVAVFEPRRISEDQTGIAPGADVASNEIGESSVGPDSAKSSAAPDSKLLESAVVSGKAPHNHQEAQESASKEVTSDVANDIRNGDLIGATGAGQEKGEEKGAEMGKWSCLGCGKVAFESLEEQRAHYRSDWHRLNVKRRLSHKDPLSLESFESMVEEGPNSDIESISGSESEDEAERSGAKQPSHRSARIAFQTSASVPFSIWRCLIGGEKEQLFGFHDKVLSADETIASLKALADPGRGPWVVLLLSGGHFAGAVFDSKGQVLVHSTAHRYVVRAKQGGRQSAKDNTGRAPKSGGASLRRYNEAALEKDVRDVLASWQEHLRAAALVFVRASSADQKTLFLGENPPLQRDDPRLRRIPFVTRRPTFSETKRVVHLLAALDTRPEMMPSLPAPEAETSKPVPKPKPPKPSKAAAPEPEPAPEPTLSLATPLHVASEAGDEERIQELLEGGADPCVRDERGRTPYMAAKEKGVRNVFRRFMAAFPDRWDYTLAAIPSPLTEDQEAAQEAKRAEKAAKRKEVLKERKKEKRAQDAAAKAAEEARKKEEESAALAAAAASAVRYGKGKGLKAVPLSKAEKEEALVRARRAEREMRALAAEKRLQPVESSSSGVGESAPKQESKQANVCDCCGDTLDGKVPFHRLQFKYCSTTCVRVHKQVLEEEG